MTRSDDSIDPHFKRHIAKLGDRLEIVANQDVFSQTGIKLLARGTRVNSTLYERILQHKMLPQLEQSLSINKVVTGDELAENVRSLLAEPSLYSRMQQALLPDQSLTGILGKIPLNQAMAFKLTVAVEELPDLYHHGVATAVCCAYIGFRCMLDVSRVIQLATAGLFHDLGELHIDPALLDRNRKLNDSDLLHIYAHPVTISMLLRQFPEYPPVIASAILEHHERLDGSGYPQGLSKISEMGQLLAVAEVATSLYRTMGEDGTARIETILKLNMGHQMNSQAISCVLAVLHPVKGEVKPARLDVDRLHKALHRLFEAFDYWDKMVEPALSKLAGNESAEFLIHQIGALKKIIECAGFNYAQIDQFINVLEADSPEAAELQNMCDEFAWRANDLMLEFQRRWPQASQDGALPIQLLREWAEQVGKVVE